MTGVDAAVDEPRDPAAFWEARYRDARAEKGLMWSGRVNAAVEREVSGFEPGTALELGSGEGADALWLAERGWSVTAVDISTAALEVGAAEAERRGLGDRVEWVQADLATWRPSVQYDLVTTAFLHSPVELPRERVLRQAASAVALGGQLLIVGHAAFPPGSHGDRHDGPPLPSSDEVLASLALPEGWIVETNAMVDRMATRPDGQTLAVTDAVLRVRRAG
ncbi:class I SAM-dependent methyltransferase [Microbacterium oryzae]|uniref:SAM-dependent methyltransferase n=1 Tax=Microbacterium oryzae TaxID=743009 RepID=UPI0025AF89A9|nr:class I SAM-dependent methyltransferase [Microbacterium oryzae]MDN3312024.1 class I SAM-dependent methyltransferase [Microbacterium oryzae]